MPRAHAENPHTGVMVTRVAKELLHRSTGREFAAPFIPFGVGSAVSSLISERSGWKPMARLQRAVATGLILGAAGAAAVAAGIIASPVLIAGAIGAGAALAAETFAPELVGIAAGAVSAPIYYGFATVDKVVEGIGGFIIDKTFRRGRTNSQTPQ